MIKSFRDDWLDEYFFEAVPSSRIPSDIEAALRRKLEIIHAAENENDLKVPPGNRFEHLKGRLKEWCSVRVNKKYRLIFKWDQSSATEIYLDPHSYKG